jgi:hypothetical protein
MKKITICFEDFWPALDPKNNFFISLLKRHFEVEVLDSNQFVDIRFISMFKKKTFRDRANKFIDRVTMKARNITFIHDISNRIENTGKPEKTSRERMTIYFTGENYVPDLALYDLTISTVYLEDDALIYMPLWFMNVDWFKDNSLLNDLMARFGRAIEPEELVQVSSFKKTKFCSAVIGRHHYLRMYAISKLKDFGGCDVYGRANAIDKKLDALEPYFYNLCFENSLAPGYITEKLIEAKMAGCVPLYYGYFVDKEKYNMGSFINLADYDMHFSDALFSKTLMASVNETPLLKCDPIQWFEEVESKILSKIKNYL